jgi:glutathione S-transferase
MEPKLVLLRVSPWSERARWALDHHRIAYRVVEHFPIIGERRLRQLVGPDKPRATVPVLLAGGEVLSESWDIARYADRHGQGTKLFPTEHEAVIQRWTTLADETMQAGRALIVSAMLASPAALDEGAPPAVPKWARPALRPVTRQATRAFGRKYGVDLEAQAAHLAKLRGALDELRKGLGAGALHLLGSFTYADIAMATLLQGISPVADRYLQLGPATRAAWTRGALAKEFADLVAWRDALYESRRKPSAS